MSSYQLGRIGITILVLYLLLEALLVAIPVVATSAQVSKDGEVFIEGILLSLATTLAVVLLIGAVPAWILFRNRERLARRWFADGEDASNGVGASQLVQADWSCSPSPRS